MKEDIQWYEFIIINWTQVVFILGVIGYIIKLFIDWDIRKKEISYYKIQESKLLEAKDFFKSYQSLRIALELFYNQTRFGKHSDDIFNNIRNDIRQNYIDFEYKCMTLKLFVKATDIETIDKILITCETIRKNIETWHIYKDTDSKPQDYIVLSQIREDKFEKDLPNLIKIIETSLRDSYNLN
jgi:hypothetical protein